MRPAIVVELAKCVVMGMSPEENKYANFSVIKLYDLMVGSPIIKSKLISNIFTIRCIFSNSFL